MPPHFTQTVKSTNTTSLGVCPEHGTRDGGPGIVALPVPVEVEGADDVRNGVENTEHLKQKQRQTR